MIEPIWVDEQTCQQFHTMLLSRYGGIEGVRDQGLLESALARAQHLYQYGEPSLFEIAAAYAHGLVKNHPFLDGNKRTGFLVAAYFIETNGYRFRATEEEAVIMTVDLAAGEIEPEVYAIWLERNSVVV
jgi:death-on-curing protein